MESFVERYLAWLDELLNDPAERRRHPTAKRLRDLQAHQLAVWERILKVSHDRSQIGYVETTITLRNGVEFYRWPGNFRKFLFLEKRVSGNPNSVTASYPTIAQWHPGPGIVLMTQERGFRVKPVPVLSANETWTLGYLKNPILPHYATVQGNPARLKLLVFRIAESIPPENGIIVRWPDYYKGEVLRILEAESGAGQSVEVTGFNPATGECSLRMPFAPTPTGMVKYEFGSFLPAGYDKLIAMSVALAYTPITDRSEQRRQLMQEWKELFASALHYVQSQTSDRPHAANPTFAAATVDPFAI